MSIKTAWARLFGANACPATSCGAGAWRNPPATLLLAMITSLLARADCAVMSGDRLQSISPAKEKLRSSTAMQTSTKFGRGVVFILMRHCELAYCSNN